MNGDIESISGAGDQESSPFFSRVLAVVVVSNAIVSVLAQTTGVWVLPTSLTEFLHSAQKLSIFYSASLGLLVVGMVLRIRRLLNERDALQENSAPSRVLKGLSQAVNSHSIVSISEPCGKIVYANNNFLNTFKYTHDELGHASEALVSEETGTDNTQLAIQKSMRSRKVWVGRQILRTKDGQRVVVSATIVPVFDNAGMWTHSISIQTDVSALEDADAQAMMSAFLGEIQDGIFVYKTNSLLLVYANPAARKLCSWNDGELHGKYITDSSELFREDLFWEIVGEPLLSGEKEMVSIETFHEKGPVEISTRLARTPCGDTVFLSVLRDITERKQVEKIRMESISQISHELRTPLTSITGSLKLLESGAAGPLSDTGKQVVQLASRNTSRLLMIINDILDFQKLEVGELSYELGPVDLGELIGEGLEVNIGFGLEHDVDLTLFTSEVDALVYGDRARLLQVVSNLISNAVKYSPSGGEIRIGLQQSKGNWRVSVSDNGPGIPKEAQDRLFKNFSQIEPVDGVSRPGSGLGLAICKKIVQMHNGKVGCVSEVGSGSEFYFELEKMDKLKIEMCQSA
ncbi:ATP-binding protein [Aliiroseovarius subalbicans]|uniref:ATP-binding protein n=1 Tax=Aliiroseovarius subalbicans TaxID=2925840 RepID=UPI001F59FF31|nr:ATP-binding protein [Aliiroseovarius subalbicans]MCI2399293.1 PAS domain-containing sensor histidine kinase [Aliiroseovarius subalbicans]